MKKATFYSYKPFLQICLSRKKGLFVTFSADCTYSPTDEEQLGLLRKYAEATKSSYIISEGMDPEELGRKNRELEDKLIQEAEARVAARAEAEANERAEHSFYSALRMSDVVRR